jgi:hypothetical protein
MTADVFGREDASRILRKADTAWQTLKRDDLVF